MAKLVFKIHKAGGHGKSPIEIILESDGKKYKRTTESTDSLLSALDRLLKSAKLKIESVKQIKLERHKQAGLTSTRIIKSIIKALSFSPPL